MRNFLIIFIMAILSVSTCRNGIPKQTYGMHETEDTLNMNQMDSVFLSDSISGDIENDWIQIVSLSERKNPIYKYLYIKELTDSTELIYTLYEFQDSLYIVNKRTVK